MTDTPGTDHFAVVQTLIEAHPDHLWAVRKLAREAGLSFIDAQAAVEELAEEGKLIPKGGGYYAHPFGIADVTDL